MFPEEKGPSSTPAKDGSATPRQIERQKKAEQISEREFTDLTKRNKMDKVPREWSKEVKSLSDLRKNVLGYKALEPNSPRLRPGNGGNFLKMAGEAGEVLWIVGVVHAFVTNSTALDRAAALTAIIPFVGWLVGTAAAVENKQNNVIVSLEAALCLIGDGLILGGLPIAGFALHLARIVVQLFTPPPEPTTKEQGLKARDDLWADFLYKHVYRYIYSHEYNDPQQAFAFKLNNTLAVRAFGMLSDTVQVIGAINASSEVTASDQGSSFEFDPSKLETGSREAIERLREASSSNIARSQRRALLHIPSAFHDGKALSLKEAGEKFNEEFIKTFKSQKNIEAYSDPKWKQVIEGLAAEWLTPGGIGTELLPDDPYAHARTHLTAVGDYLKTIPVTMPRLIDSAFIIGQSKGMAGVGQDVLSARHYIKQEVQDASQVEFSDTFVDMLAIRQAIDVAKVIQGRIKEDEGQNSPIFPVEDATLRQGLQLLLAMKCGRLYEEAKISKAEILRETDKIILSANAPEWLVNPLIPPIPTHPTEGRLLSMILGLADTVLEIQYDESSKGLLQQQVDKIKESFKGLREKVQSTTTWSTFDGQANSTSVPS